MFVVAAAILFAAISVDRWGVTNLSSQDALLIEREGAIVWLTLNRPRKCNALNLDLNMAIQRACQSITDDVSVVVLRANGTRFCAGSDLADLYQVDRSEAERVIQLEIDACHALAALPQLTVALVHGKCLGGGAILPLYCDVIFGLAGVEFALPEVALGWPPPYGIERMLARLPRAFALDMLLSGRACGGDEALHHGWLQRLIFSAEDARSFVEKLAMIPQRTLRDTCALSNPKSLGEMRKADVKALAAFLDHFDTDHARKTIASFIEKKRS